MSLLSEYGRYPEKHRILAGVIMGQFTIYKDDYQDFTVISNRFIDMYMRDANDAQIKVYLYLIRMLGANLATSVSEIADKFNHTEKDVMRALKYWEKAQLLSLEYDEDKSLTGIRLRSFPAVQSDASDHAVAQSASPANTEAADHSPAKSRSTAASVVPLVPRQPEELFAKPSYSADDLRDFKEQDSTSQLLFVAQSYIGRPLTVSDMKSILYFSDCLHFSDDLIDYLIQYCVDRGKRDFKYIEAVALNWAQSGVTTPKQAERFAAKYDKSVYTIMKELGKNSNPTSKELEYINRWLKEYGFSMDIISEACGRTVMATDSHRFEYAEGILSSWKKENVHRKSDIQRIDDVYQKRRQSKQTPAAPAANRFNQFSSSGFDYAGLEAQLLSK